MAILLGAFFSACEHTDIPPDTTGTDTTAEIPVMTTVAGEPSQSETTAFGGTDGDSGTGAPDTAGADTTRDPHGVPVTVTGGGFTTEAPEPVGTTGTPVGTTEPVGTTAGTTVLPEPPAPEPTPVDPTAVGTLLYREDFEGYGTTATSRATVEALGWKILGKVDGAYSDNTASYTIVSDGSNARLKILNYASGLSAKDSYVEILPSYLFSYLAGRSYTYQYDITYTDASNADRYLALVSSFGGDRYYNTFHLRNSGKFNNECHVNGEWKKFADAGDARSALGVTGDSIKDVTVTLRYVVDWSTGCKIYARVKGGDWVLLSQLSASANGASLWSAATGGRALVLKVGGAQNGYIDNVTVWSGTTEAPTATEGKGYLMTNGGCHSMIADGGTEKCVFCGRTQSEIDAAWLLTDIPAYEGGSPSAAVYLSGQGLDPAQPISKEDRMQTVSGTTGEEFLAYLGRLRAAGYTREFERTAESNLFASYVKGSTRVYAYYTPASREARVIAESTEVSRSVADFSYSYTKKTGDTTALYQYALPLRDATHLKSDNYVDRGMLYVVKLADNKVVIIDGGESVQFTDARLDDLMSFLREITGVGKDGTVTIAAWFLTHAHQDHVQGFFALARRYSAYLTLERVFYSIPSWHSDNATVKSVNDSVTKRMLGYIGSYFGDDNVQFLKIHTGQVIRLADVTFEILYTHEDLADPVTAKTRLDSNYNESSAVMKIGFDGKSALITGDIDTKAATLLMRNWSTVTLKVDVLQLAHHVLNDLSSLYTLLEARILLVPQSAYRIAEHSTAKPTFAVAERYADEGMIFFENVETVGLAVDGGKVTVVYRRPMLYESIKFYWPDP